MTTLINRNVYKIDKPGQAREYAFFHKMCKRWDWKSKNENLLCEALKGEIPGVRSPGFQKD